MTLLSTDRLVFRSWSMEDLPHAIRLWGDQRVTSYIDARGKLSPEQVKAKLEAEIAIFNQHGVQYWPVFELNSGDFVGCCGLKPWIHSARNGLELGFHLTQAHWGKGYASEAATGVIHFAAETLKQEKLLAGHHPENTNSRRILLKLGFSFVEDVFFKPTGLMHPSYELRLAPLGRDRSRL